MLGHRSYGLGAHRVVLLNDWTQDTTSWDGLLPFLDGDRFTWTFVDLRGYGASRHLRGDWTATEAATDVLELADAEGWPRFSLVGHSMSTLVAVHLAQHQKERLERLVLVCPPPPAGFGAPDEVVAWLGATARGDEATRAALFGADRLGIEWARWKAAAWCATSEPEAVAGYVPLFTRDGLPDPAAPVLVPTLALCGEEDQKSMRSAGVLESYGPLSADLRVVGLPDVGHYPMIELPPRTARLLQEFLGSGVRS